MITNKEKQRKAMAINELLNKKINSRVNLMARKRQLSKKYGFGILANSEILNEYRNQLARGVISRWPRLEKILRKRTVRTMSGIAPVAVLTKPYPCPGQCAYCPTEKNVPQSYLSNEPAVMRAIRCGFDPYKQVRLRLQALVANGHEPTKIELIVIGGTWSVLPTAYKYWYIKECFRAANEFESVILEGAQRPIESQGYTPNNEMRCYRFPRLKAGVRSSMTKLKQQLSLEQKKNESAKYRIIGITLETRPDCIDEAELWQMRELGATRVEIGVQALDDKILAKNKRGHGVSEIAQATKLLKNYGFKVTYHIMPGLPGATARKDLAMFKRLFTDERFQPDQIKFYPTVVTRGSLLYQWWREGKYKPYSDKVLQELIVACKKAVPPHVRIIRLIRDIPKESIAAGNIITNLRQIMKDRGVKCRCIRCREAKELRITNYELRIIKYPASGGREYFLSYESRGGKILYGFCRLRLPNVISTQHLVGEKSLKGESGKFKGFLPRIKCGVEMTNKTALIRELHVYGELVPMGFKKIVQHAGLGKKLMSEAEKIARENGYGKIAVIAGVGVRGYYRKLDYKLKDSYMVKNLL